MIPKHFGGGGRRERGEDKGEKKMGRREGQEAGGEEEGRKKGGSEDIVLLIKFLLSLCS